jgi:glycosyltransferase involved in cell wall biosynthesis
VRINLVGVSESLGGAELYLVELARALRETGVETVVLGSPESPILEAARSRGLAVGELRIGRKLSRTTAIANLSRYPLARSRLRDAVREQAASGGWTILQFKWEQILWGAEVAPNRVCLLEHGPIPRGLLVSRSAGRRLARALREAALVAAASEPAAASIRDFTAREPLWLPAAGRRSSPGTGVAAAELRKRYAQTSTLLAYAGRITRAKGVFEVAALAGEVPGLSIAISGEGPDLDALRSWIRTLGVHDRVHVTGFVDDPVPLLAAADATLLVTTEAGEGRPLAALESLEVGTPVVGLRSSPALRALSAEFPDRVHLAATKEAKDLWPAVEAALAGPRRPEPVGDWDSTARILLDAMAAADARSPARSFHAAR